MLLVDRLSVSYTDRPILGQVSLTVATSEVVSLLGPSGSGKSTLLRVIAGIVAPDAGRIVLDGADITQLPTRRRHVGMVFQDEQLFPHLNVADNIGFGLKMAGVARAEIDQRVGELLELVELAGFGRRSTDTLSGGEGKRVALARSLAPLPKVLLLDEPLTGLDTALHARMIETLAHAIRSVGVTAIHVTHDAREAHAVADRTVQLHELGPMG